MIGTVHRNVEELDEDPYITGNRNAGKEIMIIDILGTGIDNQDTTIFYQTTGIGGRFDGSQAPPDPTTNIQWQYETPRRARDSLFNNKRVYKSTVSDLWQYFTPNNRPDGRPLYVFHHPIRRQDAVSEGVEDANNNEGPTQEEIAKRIQSDTWKKEWGYGADFIKWREKEREKMVDLTDGSGSGSSSTGGFNPNHSHQRAKRKTTSDPDFERRFIALHRTGRGPPQEPPTEYYVYMWILVDVPNELRMEWRLKHLNGPRERIPIHVGDLVIRQYEGQWSPNYPTADAIELVIAGEGIGGINHYKLAGREELYDMFSLAKLDENVDLKKDRKYERVRKNLEFNMSWKEMFKAKLKF
jgi:hypothetical protein